MPSLSMLRFLLGTALLTASFDGWCETVCKPILMVTSPCRLCTPSQPDAFPRSSPPAQPASRTSWLWLGFEPQKKCQAVFSDKRRGVWQLNRFRQAHAQGSQVGACLECSPNLQACIDFETLLPSSCPTRPALQGHRRMLGPSSRLCSTSLISGPTFVYQQPKQAKWRPRPSRSTQPEARTLLTLRRILIRLVSTALTGFFYTTSRVRLSDKLSMMKYDPIGASSNTCLYTNPQSRGTSSSPRPRSNSLPPRAIPPCMYTRLTSIRERGRGRRRGPAVGRRGERGLWAPALSECQAGERHG